MALESGGIYMVAISSCTCGARNGNGPLSKLLQDLFKLLMEEDHKDEASFPADAQRSQAWPRSACFFEVGKGKSHGMEGKNNCTLP